jgi:alpha-tubulin suppressor-like RCC1 family protein
MKVWVPLMAFRSTLLLSVLFLFVSCFSSTEVSDNCGDGVIDVGEHCDGDNISGANCFTEGYYDGDLSCTDDCTFDVSDCQSEGYCGDGSKQDAEECDGNNIGDITCLMYGYWGGTPVCDSNCNLDISDCEQYESCGDGSLQPEFEICEGEDLNSESCNTLGYYGGILRCTDNCLYDESNCEMAGSCGDNIAQLGYGEECDLGDIQGESCDSLGYYGGELTCGEECLFDVSGCGAICGDGEFDENNEDCDGDFLNYSSCYYQGNWNGLLACSEECSFDLNDCTQVISMDLSPYHACAVDSSNSAWCWGKGSIGQLGNGGDADINRRPLKVTALGVDFAVISAGLDHTCALDVNGDAWCWGWGFKGQLGHGSINSYSVPNAVSMPTSVSFSQISVGQQFSCALSTTGAVYCWGTNGQGELGDGSTSQKNIPGLVSGSNTFSSLHCAYSHCCALTSTGSSYCWGENDNNELGISAATNPLLIPSQMAGPFSDTTVSIALGEHHLCVTGLSGEVYCRGLGSSGQLGNASTANVTTILSGISMPTGVSFTKVACGSTHTCALSTTGEVWCFGSGDGGQLGDWPTSASSTTTVSVENSAGIEFTDIFAGTRYSCATTTTGDAYCWGSADYGRIGINSVTVSKATPGKVSEAY